MILPSDLRLKMIIFLFTLMEKRLTNTNIDDLSVISRWPKLFQERGDQGDKLFCPLLNALSDADVNIEYYSDIH